MPAEMRRAEPRRRLDAWRRRTERRWDVDPRGPGPADDAMPEILTIAAEGGLDRGLVQLAGQLVAAGGRARARAIRDVAAGPDPAFAAALRGRLIAQLPRAGAAAPAATPSESHASPTDRRRGPFERLGAPRWTALGVVATLAFGAIGMTAQPTTRAAAQVHVTSAAGAAISGAAGDRPAAPGAALVPGEALIVTPDGSAAVTAGTAEVRLASGGAIALDRIDASELAVVQRAGRAWFRVEAGNAAPLVTIRTGGLTWTSRSAAFDLVRTPAVADGEDGTVTLVVIEGAVALHGPDLEATITEGRRCVVALGGDSPDISIGAARPEDLADPWLLRNAALDRDQGRPVGTLAGPGTASSAVTSP